MQWKYCSIKFTLTLACYLNANADTIIMQQNFLAEKMIDIRIDHLAKVGIL